MLDVCTKGVCSRKNRHPYEFSEKKAKNGKIFENLGKLYKMWRYFEKVQPYACNYRTHETARICPDLCCVLVNLL